MSTVQDCTDQTLFGKNDGANSRDLRYRGLDLSRARWRSLLEVVTPRKLTNDKWNIYHFEDVFPSEHGGFSNVMLVCRGVFNWLNHEFPELPRILAFWGISQVGIPKKTG